VQEAEDLAGRRLRDQDGSLSDRLVQDLERLIADSGLRVGDRLPSERDLTRQYGVSRSVVRHAIATLEQRGLVRARPGSGIFVADRSPTALAQIIGGMLRRDTVSLEEVLEVRAVLEVQNASLAAKRRTASQLETMERHLQEMKDARGPTSFVDADVSFHEAVSAAAGNRVAMAMLTSLRPLLAEGMLVGTGVPGAKAAAVHDHTNILEAIRDQDRRKAARLMTSHLCQAFDEWVQAGYAEPSSAARPSEDLSETLPTIDQLEISKRRLPRP